jgi:4-amino-4-deoxy-L-arabinose transferase-like glycosyltransferase
VRASFEALRSTRWPAAFAVAVFTASMLAILTRNVLGHPPVYDELLHILAARGITQTGHPVIGTGTYDRVEWFTWAVAASGRLSHNELIAARLPALLGAMLLVAAVALWTVRKVGVLGGLVAALLLACNLLTIDLAVFARFYTLHALAVFISFVCMYQAVTIGTRTAAFVLYLILGLAALGLAFYFQITTVIAGGALGAGLLAGVIAERREQALAIWKRYAMWIVGAVVLASALGLYVLLRFNALMIFRDVPLWGAGAADRLAYYNVVLAEKTPLLWPLVPFAALATCIRYPRLGWTLLIATVIAIGVHSLAASKAPRYIYYCLPFIDILLGCGLSICFFFLVRNFATRWPRAAPLIPALVLCLFGATAAISNEGYRTARLLLGRDDYRISGLSYAADTSWQSAQPTLRALAAKASAVVTSNSMKALYYLGRYDYELNASIVGETDTREEFGTDERTGGRAISTADSLGKVIRTNARTLIVVESRKLDSPAGVTREAALRAEEDCVRVSVPEDSGLTVWTCPRTVPSSEQPAVPDRG